VTVEQHLASIWEALSDELGDEPALIHGDRRVTWDEFDERASRLSAAFAAAGLAQGSVVAIDLYNCPEFFEVFFAAIKGGFTPTMVNYRYRESELHHLLADADVEFIVADPDLSEIVSGVGERLPRLRRIVETGSEYEALIGSAVPAPRRRRGDTGAMLSYTGGTTGMPKGVVYSMSRLAGQALKTRAMVAGVAVDDSASPVDAARRLHAERKQPVCCPASPLMHSTAFTFVSLPALAAGGAIATLENRRFDAPQLLDALERHAATATGVVGDAFARPLVNALDAREGAGRPFDPSWLRVMCSAGVAFSADTKRRLFEHIPALTIVDACGATEGTTYGMSVTRAGDDLSTVTFQPAPGTIVVDPERRPLPDGVVGYISALTVTSGYHKNPKQTAETFYDVGDEHRAIPGDFGRIEPDGQLTLLGRGSTVINTGGEKVHPEEVEDVIKTVPGVVDVVVWRVPDERLGSVVGAVVQRVPGAALDEQGVRDHVRSQLAGYKAPRVVVFVEGIPRHANGKLDAARISDVLGAAVSD
jgi:fatty-acyl-CoA synthase